MKKKQSFQIRQANVAPVYYGQTTIKYSFPVTVQGERNVEIQPKVDGFIEQIFVDEGASVHKGQPLVCYPLAV